MDPIKQQVTLVHDLRYPRIVDKRSGKWGVNGPARIYVVRGTALATGNAELFVVPEGTGVIIDSDILYDED